MINEKDKTTMFFKQPTFQTDSFEIYLNKNKLETKEEKESEGVTKIWWKLELVPRNYETKWLFE